MLSIKDILKRKERERKDFATRYFPKGVLVPRKITVTPVPQRIELYYSATIVNDGANPIFVIDEAMGRLEVASTDPEIKTNESLELALKESIPHAFWLKTETGTSIARIQALV